MRQLSLDYERKPGTHGIGYALLLVGCAMMAFMTNYYWALTHDLQAMRDSLQSSQAVRAKGGSKDPRGAKDLDERLLAARAVIDQLSIPWDNLFEALENIEQNGIALLAVSPDPRKNRIKLSGEAKNLEAMLAYHRSLARSPTFSDASLTTHDVVQQDPQLPVRFTATATWIPITNARK